MIEYRDESEQAILSTIMNFPDESGDIIDQVQTDYFNGKNRLIFEAIQAVYIRQAKPDLVTVAGKLQGDLMLHASKITSVPATTGNIQYHIDQVRDRYQKQRLLITAMHLQEQATKMSAEEMAAYMEQSLTAMSSSSSGDYVDSQQLCMELTGYMDDAYHGRIPDPLFTGFVDLDGILDGLRKQELIIVGARPSIGKTAFLTSILAYMTIKKVRAGLFSAEMPRLEIGKRIVAAITNEKMKIIKSGGGSRLAMIADGAIKLGEANSLWINDTPNILLVDLIRNARLMKRKHDIQILFVDYMSLLTYGNTKMATWEKIGEISKALKKLARELEMPVVVLSQVTRNSEGHEPSLADLRYSGSIEQDADVIMFLHRERSESIMEQTIQTSVIVAKNRNGETGRCDLLFIPDKVKFVSEVRR